MKEKLKKIANSRIVTLVGILIFIAICIGIGAGWAYIEHESNPTDEAVAYFRAFMQKDYDTMYNMVEQKEGDYLDKAMYTTLMKQLRQSVAIESYEVGEPQSEDGKALVVVQCMDNQAGTSEDMKIYLNKKRKGLQLIPDYTINVDEMLVDNFQVVLNKGDRLELNDTAVPEGAAAVSEDKDGHTVYTFQRILNGAYKVAAVNDYGIMSKNTNLAQNDTTFTVTGNDYTANDKYAKLLQKSGNGIIKQFYNAVRSRDAENKKLMRYAGKNKKLKASLQELVQDSMELIFWSDRKNIDSYKVTNFEMKNLKNEIAYNAKKKIYTVTYTYTYDYVASTDTALYTSYVYTLSGKCKSTLTLTYTLDKEEIVLSGIKLKNKNQKNEE